MSVTAQQQNLILMIFFSLTSCFAKQTHKQGPSRSFSDKASVDGHKPSSLLLAQRSELGASIQSRSPMSSSAVSHSSPQEKMDNKVDPFKLVENDLNNLYLEIRKELWTKRPELEQIAGYYFDGQGKAFRPMIVVLVARALNHHIKHVPDLTSAQKCVAMVAEMIHTASLVHDDVIDTADTRRGKSSVNVLWGQKKAILAGDYIISRASQMLARLRNDEVIFVLSQVRSIEMSVPRD